MADLHPEARDAERKRWIDECAAAAAALAERFGAEGVEWLDGFLADYVFAGEPLDRVLLKARELSRLPARAREAVFSDD
jgi:hypothetical protein